MPTAAEWRRITDFHFCRDLADFTRAVLSLLGDVSMVPGDVC
jgi:hypothetical protein